MLCSPEKLFHFRAKINYFLYILHDKCTLYVDYYAKRASLHDFVGMFVQSLLLGKKNPFFKLIRLNIFQQSLG